MLTASRNRKITILVSFFVIFAYIKEIILRVIAKRTLRVFWEQNPESEQQLLSWYREVSKMEWESPNEIKEQYASASILKNSRVVFNICGNKYRLIVEKFSKKMGFHPFYWNT